MSQQGKDSIKDAHFVEKEQIKSYVTPCTKTSRWLNDFSMKKENI